MRSYSTIAFLVLALLIIIDPAFAAEGAMADSSNYLIPIGAGFGIGIAALGGTLSQGKAISSALDAIGRNPSAAGKMTAPLFVGLALIESLVILTFVIANKLIG